MDSDLPYVAEYAKSGRSSCKICKEPIAKDCFRIGIMVQSSRFDGKTPMWHHSHCFLQKKKVPKSSEIANFDNLRWEDQKKIKDQVGKTPSNNGKEAANGDFSIEYSKSSRATCKTCEQKIQKGEIRVSKLNTDSPEARRFGPVPAWRHIDCFVKARLELDFSDSADKLPGFKTLSDEDQKLVLEKLGSIKVKRENTDSELPAPKKRKEDRTLKVQNELLFCMIDKLKALSKKEMTMLLQHNSQYVCVGESRIREHLADCLVFGALKPCPECKDGRARFKLDQYRCSGDLTEWTKCQYVTESPERECFNIPEEFQVKYDFLKEYKYVKRDRLIPTKEDSSAPKIKKGPLNGYTISFFGKFNSPKAPMEKTVLALGGAVNPKINESVDCCISTEAEIDKPGSKVSKIRDLDIIVVSPSFLEDVKNGKTPPVAMKENLISSWGGDPILKFGIKKENADSVSDSKSASKSGFTKSGPQKVKITVTGGAAVDPESGKEETTHVYQIKNNIYNVVLGLTDVSRGANTYYKLQILESNKGKRYWLFRSWGRIGTTIGSKLLEPKETASDAVARFEELYLEKTGNDWSDRNNFVKKPNLMYPLDIDYGQGMEDIEELKPGKNSKLPVPLQELICLIFDIQEMKKAMLEFELDLAKMPLGKLSKKQIQLAYSVLNEAQQILLTGSNSGKILDVSNRFYTLIPHDFGMRQPPLLDNEELIKTKIEMLDSLLEIEFAYNMLKGDGHESTKDPVDEHYEKLNTDIEILDEASKEFKIINTYIKNTHAETHNQYNLVLDKVFKINRHGESERYSKFKEMHNKKLLWHGSRLTNFVGILSQGLRIAPPEAPSTGYMFGKGIYFADMVSKSANYCFTNKANPTGILLLCEVALGDMYERVNAEYVTKLPKNKHSTKGMGQTMPDPKEKTCIGDVEVPYGKPVDSGVGFSSLLYNEYIVYDVNQVNIKYLLKVDFKWRR